LLRENNGKQVGLENLCFLCNLAAEPGAISARKVMITPEWIPAAPNWVTTQLKSRVHKLESQLSERLLFHPALFLFFYFNFTACIGQI
jgi:hypothetical protein